MWSTWLHTLGKMRSKPSYSCIHISKVYVCFSKSVSILVSLEQCSLLLMHAHVSLHLILVPRVCVYLDRQSRVIDWSSRFFYVVEYDM